MCDFLNSEHIYNRDSQNQVSVEPCTEVKNKVSKKKKKKKLEN